MTMPLTCGQVVATLLEAGVEADVSALERDLAEAVSAAREEGKARRARPSTPDAGGGG